MREVAQVTEIYQNIIMAQMNERPAQQKAQNTNQNLTYAEEEELRRTICIVIVYSKSL